MGDTERMNRPKEMNSSEMIAMMKEEMEEVEKLQRQQRKFDRQLKLAEVTRHLYDEIIEIKINERMDKQEVIDMLNQIIIELGDEEE